jgi:hypothetical protein
MVNGLGIFGAGKGRESSRACVLAHGFWRQLEFAARATILFDIMPCTSFSLRTSAAPACALRCRALRLP